MARPGDPGINQSEDMMAKAKANSIVTTDFDPATRTLTYTVLGVGKIPFRLGMLHASNVEGMIVNGAKQRIVDGAAISAEPLADTEEGRVAQAKARAVKKFDAMKRLVDHYETGTDAWSPAREGGTIGLDSILVQAVMEATGNDEARVRELIEANATKAGVTQRAYLAKLATGQRVAPIVDRMRAEAASGIDAEDELEGFMGD